MTISSADSMNCSRTNSLNSDKTDIWPRRYTYFGESMKIIPAQERGVCSVPYSEIVGRDGTLKFLDFACNRGLVEVRQGKENLELKVGGIVGRLPLSPRLALDISPKFPMSNLSRLLAVSDKFLTHVAPIERFYGTEIANGFLPEALIRGFAHYLRRLLETGIHKNYQRAQFQSVPRPRINLHKTQQSFWSRQKFTSAHVEVFEFSLDNSVNRIIKSAILRATDLIQDFQPLAHEHEVFVSALRYFEAVQATILTLDTINIQIALKEVPTFRKAYFRAVPIAVEILRCSNVLHEHTQEGALLPSYLLVLDDVFESYIRNTLRKLANKNIAQLKIRDGNSKKWQKYLLDDNKRYLIKPDLLIYTNDERLKIVGDVKYKIRPNEEDRYQIISHAYSYNSTIALLIYPMGRDDEKGLKKLGTIGPANGKLNLYTYHFNLSGNLEQEEQSMFECIFKLATES